MRRSDGEARDLTGTATFDVDGGVEGFGHRPIVGPKTIHMKLETSDAELEVFRSAYVPDLSDAVGQLYTMASYIHPLYRPISRAVGFAVTVKAVPGDNLTIHGALQLVKPNDFLVIDWRGTDACGSGAGSLVVPQQRGLAGVVVDGGWRDADELKSLGIPVFARHLSTFSPPKSRPGEINVPACCGGVVVEPGDIIVADEEGVVCVPRDSASEVAESLPSYRVREGIKDWDVTELEETFSRRHAFYEEIFDARGGKRIGDMFESPREP